MDVSALMGAASFIGGIGIWALRTEGRVNGHDLLFAERQKQQDSRDEALMDRLARIESKMDAYFNTHNGKTT